ncbi:hypothetical protein BDZ45DRAFT_692493 [Acephala macrosclerotiorum]|nr:hypothetical protein BDZ45DRAFT_692493 [Acephala macrosclerotiorum]
MAISDSFSISSKTTTSITFLAKASTSKAAMAPTKEEQAYATFFSLYQLRALILSSTDDRDVITHYREYCRQGGLPTKEILDKYEAAIEKKQGQSIINNANSASSGNGQNQNTNTVIQTTHGDGPITFAPISFPITAAMNDTSTQTNANSKEGSSKRKYVVEIGSNIKDTVVYIAKTGAVVAKAVWDYTLAEQTAKAGFVDGVTGIAKSAASFVLPAWIFGGK